MRANPFALSALLLGGFVLSSASALATTTHVYQVDQMPVATSSLSGDMQLAGKFGPGGTGNKLNDKAAVGKAGGRTGVGGTESAMFPKKPPTTNTAQTPPTQTSPKK